MSGDPAASAAGLPGIPGFKPVQFIGRGAFGEVWYAEESVTGLPLAVKVVPKTGLPPGRDLPRELEGVRTYQRVAHGDAHLIQIHHVAQTPECYFYAMELADPLESDGGTPGAGYRPKTLAGVLERRKPLAVRESLEVARQVLQGLWRLHSHGLVHRDVKPSNVVFVDGQAKLADPGLVAAVDQDVSLVGTPGYMAPEGTADHTTDLYAVGVMLYEMVTGLHHSQFPEPSDRRPANRSELRDLATAFRIFNRAAHPDPQQRYPTAQAMLRDLATRGGRSLRRRVLLVTACAATLVLAIGAISFIVPRATDRRQGQASPSGDSRRALSEVQLLWAKIDSDTPGNSPQVMALRYSDGTARSVKLAPAVSGQFQVVDFDGSGRELVVLATHAKSANPGRLLAFDPMEYYRTRELRLTYDADLCGTPTATRWQSLQCRGICSVRPILVADLDGQRGEELLVVALHDEGPTQIMVFAAGWALLGKYWHYGWLEHAVAINLHGDGRNEVLLWGLANLRDQTSARDRASNRYRWCAIVLGLDTLRAGDGHWSANEWMNDEPRRPPLAYGCTVAHFADGGASDWGATYVERLSGEGDLLRVRFNNGLMLDLSADLRALEVRPSEASHWEGAVPPADEVWDRRWPADAGRMPESRP